MQEEIAQYEQEIGIDSPLIPLQESDGITDDRELTFDFWL